MLARLKTNLAALICILFVFRLLVVNISIISSHDTHPSNSDFERHCTNSNKDNREQLNSITNPQNIDFTVIEIAEEDSDNEEQYKVSPFVLTFNIETGIESKTDNLLKNITTHNKHFSSNSSHRYLEYQVFRI